MYIEPFKVERWLHQYETNVDYNLTSTSITPFSLGELLEVTGVSEKEVMDDILHQRLSYGEIDGSQDYRSGIANLYDTLQSEEVISTHGGVGASHLTMMSIIEPGDHVVAILPAYQQIYSVPAMIGAKVEYLFMEKSENFVVNTERLAAMVTPKTKAICFNNPNNPTGQVVSDEILNQIVAIAKTNDAYLVCDEAYRGLALDRGFTPSVADLYEKGVSLGSMSKAFAMAGLRLGWIATKDKQLMKQAEIHRDYTMISCGGLDEYIAALALQHQEIVCQRNLGIIRERVTLFNQWLAGEKKLHAVAPQGGTVSLVYYDGLLSSEDFCRQAIEKESVLLMPGTAFELEGCFRMGCAREPMPIFEAGLSALSTFLKTI